MVLPNLLSLANRIMTKDATYGLRICGAGAHHRLRVTDELEYVVNEFF